MAQFNWIATPPSGTCVICGTSSNDSGFVDFIGDTFAVNKDGLSPELGVMVDIVICASCVHQAARVVGAGSPDEMDALIQQVSQAAQRESALEQEVDQLQQSFAELVKFDLEDLADLRELREQRAAITDLPPR